MKKIIESEDGSQMSEVVFFLNGATAVFIDHEQVPELQQPWLIKFVEFLAEQGQDPTTFKYTLPSGKNAKVFRTESGWNWGIVQEATTGNETDELRSEHSKRL